MATQELKWWHEAECQYVGLEIFYNEGRGNGKNVFSDARKICSVCPVVKECLEDAMREERGLSRDRRFGFRGGLTANGRYNLAKERGEASLRDLRDNDLIGEAA
ncbi:WhiB family transcription factor [Mycobacterium phage Whirlwind]|uniref:WhiB family transcription factor n=1 Tax=Mycobacterium phage Whirlwind TaxID=1340826 RepID=S5Z5C5_9CAUD|nr:WhiB transcriptional factor [Mycobacterium phage Whirlwind]AGT12686.1 WhiB family transcription factor [Mycobacterium phage Whirlwind]